MSWKPPYGHEGPRPSFTYRGARRKEARGPRLALVLKAHRRELGETRSQADRRRVLEAMAEFHLRLS